MIGFILGLLIGVGTGFVLAAVFMAEDEEGDQ